MINVTSGQTPTINIVNSSIIFDTNAHLYTCSSGSLIINITGSTLVVNASGGASVGSGIMLLYMSSGTLDNYNVTIYGTTFVNSTTNPSWRAALAVAENVCWYIVF